MNVLRSVRWKWYNDILNMSLIFTVIHDVP